MPVTAPRRPTTLAMLLFGLAAGVAVATAPAAAQDRWELRPLHTAGEYGGEVEFGAISAVTLGPKGVYVGDGMNLRVVILDSALQRIGSVGRPGSGPGEFRGIAELTVRGDTIYAFDARLQRLNAITDAGESVWTLTRVPPLYDEPLPPNPTTVLGDGAILVRGRTSPPSPAAGLHRFDRTSGEHLRIATMHHSDDIPIARADYEGITATFWRPVHTADRSAVAPAGAFVAVLIQSDPNEPGRARSTTSALSPMGDTLWAHTLRTPKVPIDPDFVESVVDERARKFAQGIAERHGIAVGTSIEAYREALAIPPYQVAFDRVVADAEGAVLLRRGGYGLDEVEWVRVTRAGLDAVFGLPTSHEVVAAHGRRIYTTSTGSLDEPTITVWAAEPAG